MLIFGSSFRLTQILQTHPISGRLLIQYGIFVDRGRPQTDDASNLVYTYQACKCSIVMVMNLIIWQFGE